MDVGDVELAGLEEADAERVHYHYAATITVHGKHGQEPWKVVRLCLTVLWEFHAFLNPWQLDQGLTLRVRELCIQYEGPRTLGL